MFLHIFKDSSVVIKGSLWSRGADPLSAVIRIAALRKKIISK